ncbi:hypothetical protein ACIRSU_24510 [Streptomyces sp. NPDC101160]|uniref:hypothetical protein n=1 Tax=Streptomyces sp. NPDC101160 TaxID=3366118 RepID=UPI0037FD57F4
MKQSAAKKLGVAVLGAAFAAAAAGTASAAPAPEPAGPDALGLVTNTVPVGEDVTELPAGTDAALAGGETAVGSGAEQAVNAVPGAVDQAQNLPGEVQKQASNLPLDGAKSGLAATPLQGATGLLGGLPLNGLPVGGLGGLTGGLPL